MKTQNLAVMFTDIKGFTAMTSRQTREQNELLLKRHDALLSPVVRAFGGRRVKTIGDAFLCVFPSPTNSVLCGVAIQDRLWDFNRRVPADERIEVRVAVNLGEVRVAQGDVYGEPVNIAARVEGEAEAGEVWFTEAIYLAMNKAEVPTEEVGYRELKGIPEKVRLYRVPRGRYALAATPSAAAPAEAPHAEPPYGNLALGRVKGLAAPDPAELLSQREPAGMPLPDLGRLKGAFDGLRGRVNGRPLALGGAVLGGAAVLWLGISLLGGGVESDIAAGRFDKAEAAIVALGREKGAEDPRVLFLEARLLHEKAKRGMERPGAAFDAYERALAAGSDAALAELERQAKMPDCTFRELAASALAGSRNPKARPALKTLADEEPGVVEEHPLAAAIRDVIPTGKCRAASIARRGLARIEGTP